MSKIGKGRHTSSSVVLFDLPQGGMVIDTPGIRSFGLAHVTADDVIEAFDEINEAAIDCPPLCGHTAEDPECALDAWAAAGPPARQEQLTALRVLLGAVGQVGPGCSERPTREHSRDVPAGTSAQGVRLDGVPAGTSRDHRGDARPLAAPKRPTLLRRTSGRREQLYPDLRTTP